MTSMKKFETFLVKSYQHTPRLPKDVRFWLADNAWRIVILGTLMCVFSMFLLIPVFFTALVLTPSVNIIAPNVMYDNVSLGMYWLAVLLAIITFFATAVMLSFTINPIRMKSKYGWDILFRAILLNILLGIVTLIIVPNWVQLVAVIVGTIVLGYLLF